MRAPVAPLFVPGNRPERFAKAAATDADAVIIDLEDAVDPADKAAARDNLAAHAISDKPVIARLNGAESEWWEDDLALVRSARLDGVMVPKAEDADALKAAGAGGLAVIALVETARGLSRLADLLAVKGVVCVGFGSLDFALDLGCEPDWEALSLARCTFVYQSRLAGKSAPIEGVTPAFDNPALVEEEARRARALGFGGKLAIHPKQVAPIRAAFRPDEAAIRWAEAVVASATSGAAVGVGGAMVDKPLVERARAILATR
ncbi:HpcH/HpaI aldolase/citrate lyase family protein [Acuticoccus mangrovi]|uniref:HpcH/HpaI aldolase/citrate lyase family protein n=1 Tax=Acuticoccus mangrovi TaxID=2796142 RepID=UPI002FC89795